MTKLQAQLKELESSIAVYKVLNPAVSGSDVGWHIEHSLLTINAIIGALLKSDPKTYKPRFKWSKIFILTTGFIPRGRGKAPKVVEPGVYNEHTLPEHLNSTMANLKHLIDMDASRYFDHPYFGNLQVADTNRFLEIHTSHHLKIIRDIVKTGIK